MSEKLKLLTKSMVKNLRYSWIFRVIVDVAKEDIYSVMKKLEDETEVDDYDNPEKLYKIAKRYFVGQALSDEDKLEYVLNLPKWLGFKKTFSEKGQPAQNIIEIARSCSLGTLWLLTIPKIVISPAELPHDYRNLGVKKLVSEILESDTSRKKFQLLMNIDMERENLASTPFDIESFLQCFDRNNDISEARVPHLIALTMMVATGHPIEMDKVLKIDKKHLPIEIAGYIFTRQVVKSMIRIVKGNSSRRPFEWPIIGDRKTFEKLLFQLELLRDFAIDVKSSPRFMTKLTGEMIPMTEQDYYVFLIDGLADHFDDELKNSRREHNKELANFIELLRSEKKRLAEKVCESDNKVNTLYKGLSELKKKAKAGHRPYISPEKKYRDSLSALEMKLKIKKRREGFDKAVVEDFRPIFQSAIEIINKNEDMLAEDKDQFTEAFCFETCFRILEYMNMGTLILDLPWVSRFIAEEAVKAYTMMGVIDVMSEEHRTERIVAAFMGGLVYLILQGQKAPQAA